MEGKKSRVACCVLMLLVLSAQQQQVTGLSKFCRCYRNCYTECRKTTGRYPCNANCFQDCVNRMLPPAPANTVPADCRHICLMGFCGSMQIADAMAGDAEACVADCTKNLGAFAPTAAKINNN
ncbi:hypothetical protein BDA96_04G016600 [Sorghum bicolor]|uniref:Acidic protein n=2 Tax=Sorghum bicolor TaxID=4558 RepID=A0A921UIS6_SORBI|nr:uncharacterized protein LOC8085215 [Sorghum bicolor]KAG0531356.1 hypothetical protein BDA96_04G016600 [Sorghum bicolor]KAG0531357.1 hypothetical protein BDA96_04G016600 [Sorghum bicolor]KXG29305.1 hypothetical protein SORBI_3004G014700 [Sorghum bicolor]KXG29306.1 hypothetical protein SORBI_3004G014700 [Sorghum bicolor]|eukprot:XP_002453192.2 uncharacterized protein LOC8085215 [Sorghum bicolor]